MKFITEEDLRDLYKKEPFTSYEIEEGVRLTPGARQFLLDRGINMYEDEDLLYMRKPQTAAAPPKNEESRDVPPVLSEKKTDWRKMKLLSKIELTEALLLLTGEQLSEKDVCQAQSVIGLARQVNQMKNAVKGNAVLDTLTGRDCSGMNAENFSCSLGDCFEITEFHLQFEKSGNLLTLHKLRCALHELEAVIWETCSECPQYAELCEGLIGKVNQIINTLSQMICSAFGGKECQRKD